MMIGKFKISPEGHGVPMDVIEEDERGILSICILGIPFKRVDDKEEGARICKLALSGMDS